MVITTSRAIRINSPTCKSYMVRGWCWEQRSPTLAPSTKGNSIISIPEHTDPALNCSNSASEAAATDFKWFLDLEEVKLSFLLGAVSFRDYYAAILAFPPLSASDIYPIAYATPTQPAKCSQPTVTWHSAPPRSCLSDSDNPILQCHQHEGLKSHTQWLHGASNHKKYHNNLNKHLYYHKHTTLQPRQTTLSRFETAALI